MYLTRTPASTGSRRPTTERHSTPGADPTGPQARNPQHRPRAALAEPELHVSRFSTKCIRRFPARSLRSAATFISSSWRKWLAHGNRHSARRWARSIRGPDSADRHPSGTRPTTSVRCPARPRTQPGSCRPPRTGGRPPPAAPRARPGRPRLRPPRPVGLPACRGTSTMSSARCGRS